MYGSDEPLDGIAQPEMSREATPMTSTISPPITSKPKLSVKTRGDQISEEDLIEEIEKRAKELDKRKEGKTMFHFEILIKSSVKFLSAEIQRQLTELQIESAAEQKAKLKIENQTKPVYGASSNESSDYEAILRAIREQDDQLARATESIRDEIRQLKRERLGTSEGFEFGSRQVSPQKIVVVICRYGGKIPVIPFQPANPASQVNALKSAYLMAGGHDENLIRQMNETVGEHIGKQANFPQGAFGGIPGAAPGLDSPARIPYGGAPVSYSASDALRVKNCIRNLGRLLIFEDLNDLILL